MPASGITSALPGCVLSYRDHFHMFTRIPASLIADCKHRAKYANTQELFSSVG